MTPAELRAIRTISLGLTQAELGKALFLTANHIHKLEHGIAPITARTARDVFQLVQQSEANHD